MLLQLPDALIDEGITIQLKIEPSIPPQLWDRYAFSRLGDSTSPKFGLASAQEHQRNDLLVSFIVSKIAYNSRRP